MKITFILNNISSYFYEKLEQAETNRDKYNLLFCKVMKANPKTGQYVYDPYYKARRKVMSITNGLYFIGSDHEPMHRHEFFYPLPSRVERQYISVDSKQY